jgi:protoporphyrinogen oxidase
LYFSYPLEGGFEAIVHGFARRVRGEIHTSCRVVSVARDGERWRVTLDDGSERSYRTLVSTLPIHDLLPMWEGAPAEAIEAAGRLRYNSLINVLLGFNEDRGYPYTAVYLPDPEIPFHRISFPKAFSPRCVPEGGSSLMAEITTNDEISDEEVIGRVIDDLVKMDFIDASTIVYRRAVRFKYGYPVYDLDYRANVAAMRDAVARTGLHLLGRFAQFDYINSDVCVERALALADKLRAS